jgi:hypothetical protein
MISAYTLAVCQNAVRGLRSAGIFAEVTQGHFFFTSDGCLSAVVPSESRTTTNGTGSSLGTFTVPTPGALAFAMMYLHRQH